MPDVFVAPEEKPTHHTKPHPPAKKAPPEEKTSLPSIKPQAVNALSFITSEPQNIKFENQEKNEHIYLFIRKHPITNVPWILGTVGLILVPVFFFLLLPFLDIAFIQIPGKYVLILLIFYYLIVFGYAFINYAIWFYNVGLITSLRVVDIDVSNITHKNVAATHIGDIVDVEYNQGGFLSNFFNFGNVHMQTEGIKPNFEFLSVPHPAQVADTISDLIRGVNKDE